MFFFSLPNSGVVVMDEDKLDRQRRHSQVRYAPLVDDDGSGQPPPLEDGQEDALRHDQHFASLQQRQQRLYEPGWRGHF